MKFENVKVYNFANALHGMRNPKNSWGLSDSEFGLKELNIDCCEDVAKAWAAQVDRSTVQDFVTEEDLAKDYSLWLWKNGILETDENEMFGEVAFIGPKDMNLAQLLIKSGPEHRKFLRQIFVTVDITAPLYWWKEFDTYKVGTVANSTSTMHKIASKPITVDCFEIDDYNPELEVFSTEVPGGEYKLKVTNETEEFIAFLEHLRLRYLETEDKKYWKELIRWLPEGWLQTRTVTMNYENLLAMCSKGQRRFHKLTEWSGTDPRKQSFIQFARSLPYSQEFIFIDEITESSN